MNIHFKRIIICCLLCLFNLALFSQSYSSKNNYTSTWLTSSSWIPTWAFPQTNFTGDDIILNGYIISNSSLSFSDHSTLTINDTLVIEGDLMLGDHTELIINDNAILIVRGNLLISDHTLISANAYLVVTGNITKTQNITHGSFTSNDNPIKVFIGGTITPATLTQNNSNSPIFNCSAPPTIPYPNSSCSYGNLTDFMNDPLYPFFQTACSIAKPTITTGGATTFCAGGSITLTSSAGTTYLWSTGATTPSINVTLSGSYTVRVTNVNGCLSAASAPIVITVNSLPATPTITAGGPSTFCDGANVTLTSSVGSTYLWSTGETTPYINVTLSGNYSVVITNSNGCQSASSATIPITVNALPATPTITAAGPTTFCSGGSVTLTSSPGTSYLWSTGATTSSINITATGNYSVKVTNANGCQSASSAVTAVTVNSLPAAPVISDGGPTTFCEGGSVALTSSPGTTYLWSTGATTQNINPTTSGTYSVRITNANGCQSSSSVPAVVTVNALPAMPVITSSGPTTFCEGGSVTLTSSQGSDYLWSTGAITPGINISTAGSYTVQVTDANECQSVASAAVVTTINTLPVVNAGTDVTIPNGTSTTIDATVSGDAPFTYNWSPAGQLVNALIEDPTTINLPATTIFMLTATSVATGCSNTNTVTISTSGGPLSSVAIATPSTVCSGKKVQLNAIASGGSGLYTYAWTSIPAGFTSSIANPSVNPLVSTTYNVAVDDGFNIVNSQVNVTVNALPATPTITASGPTTFCEGSSVALTSSPGTTYLWSTGETTSGINVSTTGSYTVQVTNTSGCQSASSLPVVVTENALPLKPVITAAGPTTFCEGGSVTLTSSAGTSYLWSTGETSPGINVGITGSYTIRVTNENGCQSTQSAATKVTVNALPSMPTITATGPTTFCAGGSVTLNSSPGTTYLWSTAEVNPGIIVTSSGSYIVQVTDANGCQSAQSLPVTVTENALPLMPTVTASGPTTFCEGGSVTLTSSPGAIYLWSTGESTPSINVSTTGSYTLQVTDANECRSATSVPVIVIENALPATPIITASGPTTFCEGSSVTLTSSPEAIYLWSTGENDPNITVTTSGNYSVRVTSANGCQSAPSVPVIVTENPLPATPAITAGGPTTFCEGTSVILTSSVGTTYLWSTAETNPDIIVNISGSYTVQVTDVNGCLSFKSAPVIITENAKPAAPTITTGGNTSFCEGGGVTLTSSAGTTYLWSTGATSAAINVTSSGSYSVQVTDANGCQSDRSLSIDAVLGVNPVAIAGPDQELQFKFETQMNAELDPYETGEWSLISGSGRITDINSPTTMVTDLSVGENIFLWKVNNGNCESSSKVKITVLDLFVPSVITPDGDGKNDYFKISNIDVKVELIIFDRWGNEEYTNLNYSNDWNGLNDKGKELPSDTYFYILKVGTGKIIKGSVFIKR